MTTRSSANSDGLSSSASSADTAYRNSPEQYHSVGPLFDTSPKTTALEFIGTRALPDDIQGTALIGGYFGAVAELHRLHDDGSGFRSTQLPKLLKSSNAAFRPVDVSVSPDGAMYIADWFNPIIGHYQASYSDPRRDKSNGRIWRIIWRGLDGSAPQASLPNLAAPPTAALVPHLSSSNNVVRSLAVSELLARPDALTSARTVSLLFCSTPSNAD